MTSQATGTNGAFAPNRLKLAAHDRLFTLPALARELGVSEKSVYRWNAGDVPPRLGNARKIAELLGRDLGWFYESATPDVDETPAAA